MLGLWALMPSSVKQYLFAGIAVLIMAAAAYFYFTYTQNKMDEQARMIQQLQVQTASQQAALDETNRNVENATKLIVTYEGRLKKIADDSAKLRRDLDAMGIQKLAKTNPVEAQRLVNQALTNMLIRIENVTRNVPDTVEAKGAVK